MPFPNPPNQNCIARSTSHILRLGSFALQRKTCLQISRPARPLIRSGRIATYAARLSAPAYAPPSRAPSPLDWRKRCERSANTRAPTGLRLWGTHVSVVMCVAQRRQYARSTGACRASAEVAARISASQATATSNGGRLAGSSSIMAHSKSMRSGCSQSCNATAKVS